MDTLLEKLEQTRKGYREEALWHRFLVDGYTGLGGFEGVIKAPDVGYWGAGAQVYAATASLWADASASSKSYLVRHPREDEPKFQKRLEVAHYLNYVEPLTDLKVSYALGKPFTYQDEIEDVKTVREAVWADLRPSVAIAAALVGWTPVLVDRPESPEGLSRAQQEQLGLSETLIHQLAPSNLLQWSMGRDGQFDWVKIRTCHEEQSSWDSKSETVELITVWTRTEARRWEVRKKDGGDKVALELPTITHAFGRVPLTIFRHKRVPGVNAEVRGLPMHAGITHESRRLYNLTSEFDEHIRGQVFALLVMPEKNAPQGGERQVGVENGLIIDPEQTNVPMFLAPPASVAETLEKRTEVTVKEIYRQARVEYSRPTGAATSGLARKYDFASTNKAIADYGGEFARGESDLQEVIALANGKPIEDARKQRAIAPENYDVDDLAADLKEAADAITLGLGPTAELEIKSRTVDRILPHLLPKTREQIRKELEAKAKEPPPAPPGVPPVPPKPSPGPAPAPTAG